MALTVPASVVPVLRAAFIAQGLPATTVNDAGELDPFGFLSGVYNNLTFVSNATAPVPVEVGGINQGPPNPFLVALKPTLILSGRGGRVAIAPYGEANPYLGTVVMLGAFMGIFLVGVAVGRARAKSRS